MDRPWLRVVAPARARRSTASHQARPAGRYRNERRLPATPCSSGPRAANVLVHDPDGFRARRAAATEELDPLLRERQQLAGVFGPEDVVDPRLVPGPAGPVVIEDFLVDADG